MCVQEKVKKRYSQNFQVQISEAGVNVATQSDAVQDSEKMKLIRISIILGFLHPAFVGRESTLSHMKWG